LPEALGRKTLPRPSQVFPPMVKSLVDKCENFPPSVDKNATNGCDDNLRVVRLKWFGFSDRKNLLNKVDSFGVNQGAFTIAS
jgi:hypothetical protein